MPHVLVPWTKAASAGPLKIERLNTPPHRGPEGLGATRRLNIKKRRNKGKMTQEEIDVGAFEAALIKYAGQETLDVLQKREEARRADAIEKATAPLYAGLNENRQSIEKLQNDFDRMAWEASPEAEIGRLADQRIKKTGESFEQAYSAISLARPDLYEKVVSAKAQRILAKAMIEKSESERASKAAKAEAIEKQTATAKIQALAIERQKRDGGTLAECGRVIRLENPDLVQQEIFENMEAQ